MGKHGGYSVNFFLNVPFKKKNKTTIIGTSYKLMGELLDRNGKTHVCRFRISFQ